MKRGARRTKGEKKCIIILISLEMRDNSIMAMRKTSTKAICITSLQLYGSPYVHIATNEVRKEGVVRFPP